MYYDACVTTAIWPPPISSSSASCPTDRSVRTRKPSRSYTVATSGSVLLHAPPQYTPETFVIVRSSPMMVPAPRILGVIGYL